jgi:hypothetical protein
MSWLACGKHGDELIFDYEPYRVCVHISSDEKVEYWKGFRAGPYVDEPKELPYGSIKKLIGKNLTWNDEPVEFE